MMQRDAWLRDQGFIVVRVWNNDVLENIDGVLEMIAKTLQSTPTSSPQGGRRKTKNANYPVKLELEP